MSLRAPFLFASVSVALLGACSSSPTTPPPADGGDPNAPPRVCKTPGDHPLPWFTDVTSEYGLAKTANLEPYGVTVQAVDLDGDGYADLVSIAGDAQRGAPTSGTYMGKRLRFLFMNRPSPNDAKKRVFVDATMDSGLLATRDGAGDRGFNLANAADVDNDGDTDLVLCPADALSAMSSPKDACDAFLNDGKAHFTLAPPSELGAKVFWVPGASMLDYDRDGAIDFWPATVAHWPYDPSGPNNQPPTLFKGAGDGTFTNVSAAVGLPTKDGTLPAGTQWRHMFGVTACDIDGDGDDDLIAASYGREENQVWRNDDGTFVNAAADLGLDHDDRVDYSDDQSYRCWCQTHQASCPNVPPPTDVSFCTVFGGQYGRGWQPGVTDKAWSLGGNYFSVACGDVDDDGDMDTMSATIVHGDVGTSADPTELALNPGDGSKFTRPGNEKNGIDRPEVGILWNHGEDLAVMVDVDNDGLKDLFTTTTGAYEATNRASLWHQIADHKFEEIGITSGIGDKTYKRNLHGPAFVDIDNDGDLDLVIGATTDLGLRVFRNDAANDQNWLKVKLAGKGMGGANASAIGAVVRVTAGGRTQTQYVSGGYGHGNYQSDLVLTFGLGAACDVDKVEVRWPNAGATTSTFTNVRANYAVTIKEGATAVEYKR